MFNIESGTNTKEPKLFEFKDSVFDEIFSLASDGISLRFDGLTVIMSFPAGDEKIFAVNNTMILLRPIEYSYQKLHFNIELKNIFLPGQLAKF